MQLYITALGYIRFRPGHVYVWELWQLLDGFLNINHIGVTWGIWNYNLMSVEESVIQSHENTSN